MKITAQQKKILWVCFAVFVGSYFARFSILSALQMVAYSRHIMQHAQEHPKPSSKPIKFDHAPIETVSVPIQTTLTVPAPEPPPSPPPVQAPIVPAKPALTTEMQNRLLGVWQGRTSVVGRGVCDLSFEFRLKDQQIDTFSGFTRLSCAPTSALTGTKTPDLKALAIDRTNPEAAVLTGELKTDGSLEFKTEQAVNNDSSGCITRSLTLTQFGSGQLAARWDEDDPCHGGSVIMRRIAQ